MPRRPSGSVLHALSSPSRAQQQAQKPAETRPPFPTTSTTTQNSSTPTLGPALPPATPQQKVVHALVNRLKNKVRVFALVSPYQSKTTTELTLDFVFLAAMSFWASIRSRRNILVNSSDD